MHKLDNSVWEGVVNFYTDSPHSAKCLFSYKYKLIFGYNQKKKPEDTVYT